MGTKIACLPMVPALSLSIFIFATAGQAAELAEQLASYRFLDRRAGFDTWLLRSEQALNTHVWTRAGGMLVPPLDIHLLGVLQDQPAVDFDRLVPARSR